MIEVLANTRRVVDADIAETNVKCVTRRRVKTRGVQLRDARVVVDDGSLRRKYSAQNVRGDFTRRLAR